MKTYISVLVGEVKDNYMAIGTSEEEAKARIVEKYYGDADHNEESLNEKEIYIDIIIFDEKTTAVVY